MSIGSIKSEADLERFLRARAPRIPRSQVIDLGTYPEVSANLDAPSEGCSVFCIDDNGSGKRELRARFPTGAVQVLATEP